MALTAEERSTRARQGAYAQKSKHDLGALTESGLKAANRTRFEDQVDPDRKLPPAERKRRADAARKAHMHGLALRSAIARRKQAGT